MHGFVTLTPDVEVSYKVDEYYAPKNDRSVRFDDPDIGVDWGVKVPLLSDKDMNAPLLKDSERVINPSAFALHPTEENLLKSIFSVGCNALVI